MSKIVVTLENLDPRYLQAFWKEAQKYGARVAGGFQLKSSDDIHIDMLLLGDHDPNIFANLMAGVSAGYLQTEINKFFNT